MSQEALDEFGPLLMARVRDRAIADWDSIMSGHMKGPRAERVREQPTELNDDQRRVLHDLVPQVVDTTLHFMMWLLEQERRTDVRVTLAGGAVSSLRDESDGLAGDLHAWTLEFSSVRYSSPV